MSEEKTIPVLTLIQNELKAPKSQEGYNNMYRYRSCEDILEAVKPILKEHGAILVITDSIELIGDRFYVKATCKISGEGVEPTEVSAYARETEKKNPMDLAQITGACSSYARKYALNGLFLIDDTKDADSQKPPEQAKETPKPKKAFETMALPTKNSYIQTWILWINEGFKEGLGSEVKKRIAHVKAEQVVKDYYNKKLQEGK